MVKWWILVVFSRLRVLVSTCLPSVNIHVRLVWGRSHIRIAVAILVCSML